MKRRIIYTGAFRFPDGDAAAARVLNNGKLLRDLGYDVFFAGWEAQERAEDNNDGNFFYQGFQYKSMCEFRQNEMSLLKRVFNFLLQGNKTLEWIESNNDKFHCIILYNPSYIFYSKMRKFANKMRIPLILDITEWYDNSHLPGGKLGPVALDNNIKMNYAFKRAKNLILISSFLEKYYRKSNNNIVILPPLIDKNDTKWIGNTTDSQFVRLLYAGSPAKKDLIALVVDAVKEAIDNGCKINFNIVGITYKQYCALAGTTIDSNYLESIIFHGRVPQSEVPLFYLNTDFSIIIRPLERFAFAGFPTKLVESQMAGIPVIANSTSDIAQYVKNGVNGLIIDGKATKENILDVLYKLCEMDRATITKMKLSSRECAIASFHYDSKTDEMSNFIKNIKL